MKLQVLPSAWEDIAEGFRFYEARAAGLGNDFRESLIGDIEALSQSGGIHRVVFGYHRALARRFPFAIYYSCQSGIVTVSAVLDCRRDPTWIRKHLT